MPFLRFYFYGGSKNALTSPLTYLSAIRDGNHYIWPQRYFCPVLRNISGRSCAPYPKPSMDSSTVLMFKKIRVMIHENALRPEQD